MTDPGKGSATAHDATVSVVNGPDDLEARARAVLKASAAVEHTYGVMLACDEAIERAHLVVEKATAALEAAHRQLEAAAYERQAAGAEHERFVAAYNELKGSL